MKRGKGNTQVSQSQLGDGGGKSEVRKTEVRSKEDVLLVMSGDTWVETLSRQWDGRRSLVAEARSGRELKAL